MDSQLLAGEPVAPDLEYYVAESYNDIDAAREALAAGDTLSVDEMDARLAREVLEGERVPPLRLALTRGPARRLAFQILNGRLRAETTLNRRERRKLVFARGRQYNISSMARSLREMMSEATVVGTDGTAEGAP